MKQSEQFIRAFPLAGIDAAMRRAALRARALAEQTGTPLYVLIDGQIVDLLSGTPWQPDAVAPTSPARPSTPQ